MQYLQNQLISCIKCSNFVHLRNCITLLSLRQLKNYLFSKLQFIYRVHLIIQCDTQNHFSCHLCYKVPAGDLQDQQISKNSS